MPTSEDLYPFQREGVAALLAKPALLLADDMGLGKTVQALAALRLLVERGEVRRALVIAPTGLLTQWRRALSEWAPHLTAMRVGGPVRDRAWQWAADRHVHLVSYDTARNDIGAASRRRWDVVILDEAQRIKNRDTSTSRTLKRLPRDRSWALTGTPLENREDDLASILEFVRPNPEGAQLASMWSGIRLTEVHAELQLRRRKQDVLKDLPPKSVVRLPLELSREQRRSYEAIRAAERDRLLGLGARATTMNVLEVISRLKQICNACPDTGRSSKLDDLVPRMESIVESGHRALVFSQWTRAPIGTDRIAHELRAFRPLVYTGAMSGPERDATVQRFKDDPEHGALILSLRAGGQGLNLQEASYVVHFDRWWNPAVENQATDRAHRAGQTNPVTVYCYTCVDTIEERIEEILDEKRILFAALVDHVSLDLARILTREELFGLLDLPAPARPGPPGPRQVAAIEGRVTGVLRQTGWMLRDRVRPAGDTVTISAERPDETGRPTAIWAACVVDGQVLDADDIRAIADAAREEMPVQVVVVSETGFADAARAAARDAGVTLWSQAELEEIERAFV